MAASLAHMPQLLAGQIPQQAQQEETYYFDHHNMKEEKSALESALKLFLHIVSPDKQILNVWLVKSLPYPEILGTLTRQNKGTYTFDNSSSFTRVRQQKYFSMGFTADAQLTPKKLLACQKLQNLAPDLIKALKEVHKLKIKNGIKVSFISPLINFLDPLCLKVQHELAEETQQNQPAPSTTTRASDFYVAEISDEESKTLLRIFHRLFCKENINTVGLLIKNDSINNKTMIFRTKHNYHYLSGFAEISKKPNQIWTKPTERYLTQEEFEKCRALHHAVTIISKLLPDIKDLKCLNAAIIDLFTQLDNFCKLFVEKPLTKAKSISDSLWHALPPPSARLKPSAQSAPAVLAAPLSLPSIQTARKYQQTPQNVPAPEEKSDSPRP